MGIYFDKETAAVYREGDSRRTVTHKHWSEIVFSDPAPDRGAVVGGLFFSLMQGWTSTATAREVLDAYGAKAPGDTLTTIRAAFFAPPWIKNDDGTISRPFQVHDRQADEGDPVTVWGLIFGLESGLIQPTQVCGSRALEWSKDARAAYEGKRAAPMAQPSLF